MHPTGSTCRLELKYQSHLPCWPVFFLQFCTHSEPLASGVIQHLDFHQSSWSDSCLWWSVVFLPNSCLKRELFWMSAFCVSDLKIYNWRENLKPAWSANHCTLCLHQGTFSGCFLFRYYDFIDKFFFRQDTTYFNNAGTLSRSLHGTIYWLETWINFWCTHE